MVGKRSPINPVSNKELTLQYDDTTIPNNQPALATSNGSRGPPPTTVHVSQINKLKPNQKINITATATKDLESENTYAKEDCVLRRQRSYIMTYIWHPLIEKIKSEQSYLFKHLTKTFP